MKIKTLGALALLCAVSVAGAQSPQWQEGKNYIPVTPPQPVSVPAGMVEVTEVFSYACPACNGFYPMMDRLRSALGADVVVDYVAAGFHPSEDWAVFQRAYYAAKDLGIAAKTHDAMFDAVWKTGQLQTMDRKRGRMKSPLPSIEDVAQWYHQKTGVSTRVFLSAAHSSDVDLQVQQADHYIMACQVEGTPTIIVNGRYRVDPNLAGGFERTIELVKWLVARQARH